MAEVWLRLVRFGFRLLYNEMAFTYDLVSSIVSLGAWRCWQRTALKHLDVPVGAEVLELAHGTGNLQLDLHTAGHTTFGCDLSPHMGQIAHRKLHRDHLPSRLVRARAQQLPFPSGHFAAVVSTFPTDFIVAPETLEEVHRVLLPDGLFLIVPNGILTGGEIISRGIEWLYRITGQREGTAINVEWLLAPYGFQAQVVEEQCPRSLAQVIIARKKA